MLIVLNTLYISLALIICVILRLIRGFFHQTLDIPTTFCNIIGNANIKLDIKKVIIEDLVILDIININSTNNIDPIKLVKNNLTKNCDIVKL